MEFESVNGILTEAYHIGPRHVNPYDKKEALDIFFCPGNPGSLFVYIGPKITWGVPIGIILDEESESGIQNGQFHNQMSGYINFRGGSKSHACR